MIETYIMYPRSDVGPTKTSRLPSTAARTRLWTAADQPGLHCRGPPQLRTGLDRAVRPVQSAVPGRIVESIGDQTTTTRQGSKLVDPSNPRDSHRAL
jgi:hypothetical protein